MQELKVGLSEVTWDSGIVKLLMHLLNFNNIILISSHNNGKILNRISKLRTNQIDIVIGVEGGHSIREENNNGIKLILGSILKLFYNSL